MAIFLKLREGATCPITSIAWQTRSTELGCTVQDKYHCLRNEKGRLGEICFEPSWIQAGILFFILKLCVDKGSITIRRTPFPSMLVNFSTFAFLFIFFNHEVKITLKFWVSGPYLYNKYHLSRFLCLSGHFFVRIHRDFIFFLYDTVPPCDTQLPLEDKCRLW